MKNFVAATVTVDDLKNYFKGEHWRSSYRDGVFEARSDSYYVELRPASSPQFAVSVHAYDDESDRDEAVTDDPMKFLVDFLKTGTAGDEELKKMAAALDFSHQGGYVSPVAFANLLRTLALDAESQRIGPRALARLLRRAALCPTCPGAAVLIATGRRQIENEEMKKLADKMTGKGWRVKVGESDRELPQLTVDIAGIYEAKIEVDSIPWHYSFEVHEHPETLLQGVTDDPIAQFRKFYKSDVVQAAKSDLRSTHKRKREQAEQEGTRAPQARGRRPREPYGDYESSSPS